MFDLDLVPSNEKTITPNEFLSLSSEDKINIESCIYVPSPIGSPEFGHFLIKSKTPTYSLPNA